MNKMYQFLHKYKPAGPWPVLLTVLFLSIAFRSSAQVPVSGRITDSSGYSLAGATISIKGTSKGTVTDNDGKFSITVPDTSSVLIISYLGYETREVKARYY